MVFPLAVSIENDNSNMQSCSHKGSHLLFALTIRHSLK